MGVAIGGHSQGRRIGRIDNERPIETVKRSLEACLGKLVPQLKRVQHQIICVVFVRRLVLQSFNFGVLQARLDSAYNACRYAVLQFENVVEDAVEGVGPDMDGIASVDQLSGNTDPVSDFAHAAFEHIAYTKFAGDLLHIDILAFVGEA